MPLQRKRSLGVLLLVLACGVLSAGEKPAPAPDLEALVRLLNDERFETREQATRDLIALGKEAGRKLLAFRDHDDPEVRLRIRRVLAALDIMTPEDEKAYEVLIERLFEVPAGERRDVVDEIAALGRVAVDRLQARLLVSEGQLRAVCKPVARWLVASDRAERAWQVRLTNTGRTPVLIAPPRINRGGWSISGLVPWRLLPGAPVGIGGGGFGFVRSGMPTCTLGRARILEPGGSIDLPARSLKLDRPGCWSTRFRVQVSGQEMLGRRALRFGVATGETWNGTWKPDPVMATGSVHVYPDWTRARDARGVGLVVVPRAETVEAGATLAAEIRMENRGDDAVRIDANWPRYCWIAFAHAGGEALVSSTAFRLRDPKGPDDDEEEAFVPHELAAGDSVTQPIILTVPATPGTYHLAAGYDLPPQGDPEAGDGEAHPSPETLVGRAVDVAVSAAR